MMYATHGSSNSGRGGGRSAERWEQRRAHSPPPPRERMPETARVRHQDLDDLRDMGGGGRGPGDGSGGEKHVRFHLTRPKDLSFSRPRSGEW
jgi:hypothetical protein